MAGHEDILSELPAPNPDEPTSLRQDIAEELADHLQCAALRESHSASHPEEVEQRVLARFGDPKKIARQLWFEAMKEILMTQKITLVLVSIVAIASAIACGLMWSLAREFQSASTELLSQSREVNTELLAQLSAIANRDPDGPNLMEWVPLKIQVVKNDDAKTPGEGFRVQLFGHAISEAEKVYLRDETDESGMIVFGLVRPGRYQASVYTPWGETLSRESVLVKPGSPHVETIIAPAGPPEQYQVKPVVEWKELEGTNVAVLVGIQRIDATKVDEYKWGPPREHQYLLIRPDGRFAIYSGITQPGVPDDSEIYKKGVVESVIRFESEPEVFNETFAWRGREVRISELTVLRLPQEDKFPGAGDFLVSLSRSPYLRGSQSAHLEKFKQGVQSIERVPGDDPQVWNLQVDLYKAAIARSLLAIEEFPPVPNSAAIMKAFDFFGRDRDRNMELSEEEASYLEPKVRQLFQKFPVTFETYVKTLLETSDD